MRASRILSGAEEWVVRPVTGRTAQPLGAHLLGDFAVLILLAFRLRTALPSARRRVLCAALSRAVTRSCRGWSRCSMQSWLARPLASGTAHGREAKTED